MRINLSHFFKRKPKRTSAKLSRHSSMLTQVYTSVYDLRIGMYVSQLDRPWRDTPFKFQGFLIETAQELATLRSTCEYVYIDLTQQKRQLSNANGGVNRTGSTRLKIKDPIEKLGTFEQEF